MFYLFHGDDDFSKQETLARLIERAGDRQLVDLNTQRLDGKGLTAQALMTACSVMPFLAPFRLVLVNDWLTNKPSAAERKLVFDYLPSLPPSTRLVFLESATIPSNNPLLQLANADGKGVVRLFERPKGASLDRWIVEQVRARGGDIAPQAVQLLSTNVGNDLALLTTEIEKLTLYRGSERIQSADVTRLSPYLAEANIFELVDAIGNRNGRVAVQLLQQSLAEGGDPFYLFSMVARQFRLLLQTRAALDAGTRPEALAETVGMHPFVAQKVARQARSFSLDQLKAIYRHLLDIDVRVKTGQTELVTALDLLVAQLAL